MPMSAPQLSLIANNSYPATLSTNSGCTGGYRLPSPNQQQWKIKANDSGYQYNADGVAMVEYHIDTCDIFQKIMNETKFGAHLSVRKMPMINH